METDGLPAPRRNWAILTIALGISMAVLDSTAGAVALPTIARDLGASAAQSIWVVNAFQLTMVVCLLPFASLGEIVGYRRIYRLGLALLVLSSMACALSDSLTMLIFARAMQGVGAAATLGVNAGLLRHAYPQAQLGRGIAINAGVVASVTAFGPSIGAAILAVSSWHWIYAVNVPIGLLVLFGMSRALPATEPQPRRFDLVGAGLNALTFGLIILGVEGLTQGQSPVASAMAIAAGVAFGVLLVRWSLDQPAPIVPIDLLRIPILRLSLLTGVCAFAAQMGGSLMLPFVLQYGYGRSPEMTGLLMTPWPVATLAAAPIAARLVEKYPAGLLGGLGMAAMAMGLVLVALLPPDPGFLDLAWRLALCGRGFGLFQTPNNQALLSAAPIVRAGAAGGLLAIGRLSGFIVGAVAATMLFRLRPEDHGPLWPMLICAAFALLAGMVSLTRIGKEARG